MTAVAAGLAAALAAMIAVSIGSRVADPSRRPIARRPLTTTGARPPGVRLHVAIAQRYRHLASRRRRHRGISAEAVATWCDAIARRVRSGSTLREAARVEVPSDALLAELTEPLRLGVERGASLTVLARELPADPPTGAPTSPGGQHLALAGSVIASASEVGGSAAPPLDRVAAALRLRTADAQERNAHSAQARLSAHVLTVVPVAILGLFVVTDADVRLTLSSAAGAIAVSAGLLLNVTGWWWMRRIIGTGG